jgi:prophage regulatory protein
MNPIIYDRSDLRRRGIKLSNSTLLRLESAGRFPKRVRVGDHSVAWIATEIDGHIAHLAQAREVNQ